MPKFSESSKERLKTCDIRLQHLFEEVIKYFDCTIVYGHRTEAEQNEAYDKKFSKVQWPNSKHNKIPSKAVDAVPYPVDWQDIKRMHYFAGWVMGIAKELGLRIRWGGDWNRNTEVQDETFPDLAHFELED